MWLEQQTRRLHSNLRSILSLKMETIKRETLLNLYYIMLCYTKKTRRKNNHFLVYYLQKNRKVPWLYNAYLKYHLCSVHKWQSCQVIGPDRSKNGQVNNLIMEHNSKEWESEKNKWSTDKMNRWFQYLQPVCVCRLQSSLPSHDTWCELWNE